jgi:hypothetical protein
MKQTLLQLPVALAAAAFCAGSLQADPVVRRLTPPSALFTFGDAGAPYMAFFLVPRAQVEFTGERRALYRSSAVASRGFCGRCGTALTWEGDKHPDMIDIAIATLDEPARLPPTDQIFAAEAIDWARDLSALPSHPGHRSP